MQVADHVYGWSMHGARWVPRLSRGPGRKPGASMYTRKRLFLILSLPRVSRVSFRFAHSQITTLTIADYAIHDGNPCGDTETDECKAQRMCNAGTCDSQGVCQSVT